LIKKMLDVFIKFQSDEDVRVVVLKGNGDHFCAGADIDWMLKLSQSSFELSRDDARNFACLLSQMYLFPKPIITLVQGSVLGGGLGLLACSDIVIAAHEASFCFSEVKIGLVPAVISPYIISILGEHKARYYFLTAERFNAAEAYQIGLVHRLVAAEDLLPTYQSIVKMLLNNSPGALREVKRMLPLIASQDISPELAEKTAEIYAKMRTSTQAREGLSAFLEKRSPLWK
ncbi:MAG TPA: enoyl-CoA hydratase-related protein, partial [Gammaproteobacteria bacterium]|nr:enoyl-CoA hydratase-related protein [Gammaproteobacteria bacterium]